jgi:hypothetical protein
LPLTSGDVAAAVFGGGWSWREYRPAGPQRRAIKPACDTQLAEGPLANPPGRGFNYWP